MKATEYFTFVLPPDVWSRKPRLSSFKLTVDEAADRHPGATPLLDTREVRDMPTTEDELAAALYSHFNGYPATPSAEKISRTVQEYEPRTQQQSIAPGSTR
jgi:hypothetical protein